MQGWLWLSKHITNARMAIWQETRIKVTPAEYRILTRCIQQMLEPAVRAVVGGLETAAALIPWCASLGGMLPGAGPDTAQREAAAQRSTSGGKYFPFTTFRRLNAHTRLTLSFLSLGVLRNRHRRGNRDGTRAFVSFFFMPVRTGY